MSMSLRFEIFPADLDRTAEFYIGVLAFELVTDQREQSDPYLAMRRGSVRIGAAARPADGLQGWSLEEDLTERPWGLRDFRLLDPDGYYLRITGRTITGHRPAIPGDDFLTEATRRGDRRCRPGSV